MTANEVRISVGVDNDTARGLAEVRASIDRLRAEAMRDITVRVNADTRGLAAARAEIAALRAAGDRDVHVNVTGGGLGGLGGLPALLGAIIPLAAQAAGALALVGAQLGAASIGVGVFAAAALPGLSQIKSALSLHTQALKQNTGAVGAAAGPNYALAGAKRQLADAIRSGNRAIADANEALRTSENDLARTIKDNTAQIQDAKRKVVDAQKAVTLAERDLTDANRAAKGAQEDLNQARLDAAQDLADLNDKLTDSSLATTDATLSLQQAEEDLQNTLGNTRASELNRQQAQLRVDEAKQHLKEQVEAQDKLKKSAADQVKAGVEGSKKVIDAQDRLRTATERQVDAAAKVTDAQQGVKDAIKGVADAQDKAAQRMQDAQQKVADAARNVARAHEDAASQIAAAQASIRQAMQKTGGAVSAGGGALSAYQKALAAMNPATRDAYEHVLKLKAAFKAWGDSLAPKTMPVVSKFIDILILLLPKLSPLVVGVAKVLQDLMDKLYAKVKKGQLDHFIEMFTKFSVDSLKHIVRWVGDLVGHLKNIFVSKTFKDFMDSVKKNGPGIANTLKDLAKFIGKFVGSSAGLAGLQLKIFGFLADDLNRIPVPVLDVLAPLILGIAFGMKTLVFWQTAWNIVLAITTGELDAIGIGEILLLIGLLILAIIEIVKHHKVLWKIIKQVWGDIVGAFKTAWHFIQNNVLEPMGNFFTKTIPNAFKYLWNHFKSGLGVIKDIFKSAWNWVKDKSNSLVDFFKGMPSRIGRAFRGAFNGLKDAFRGAINWVIDRWNNFHLKIGGGSVLGVKVPSVTLNTPNIPHLAHGGVSGGGITMVGENGPEMVRLPAGSSVRSNPDSQGMMGGNGGVITLDIRSSGSDFDDLIMKSFKRTVNKRGGNVQLAVMGRP